LYLANEGASVEAFCQCFSRGRSGLLPVEVKSQWEGGRETLARLNERTGAADVRLSVAAMAQYFACSSCAVRQRVFL
jgi:hypothetical protein